MEPGCKGRVTGVVGSWGALGPTGEGDPCGDGAPERAGRTGQCGKEKVWLQLCAMASSARRGPASKYWRRLSGGRGPTCRCARKVSQGADVQKAGRHDRVRHGCGYSCHSAIGAHARPCAWTVVPQRPCGGLRRITSGICLPGGAIPAPCCRCSDEFISCRRGAIYLYECRPAVKESRK